MKLEEIHQDVHTNQVCSMVLSGEYLITASTDMTLCWNKVSAEKLVQTELKLDLQGAKINTVAAAAPHRVYTAAIDGSVCRFEI